MADNYRGVEAHVWQGGIQTGDRGRATKGEAGAGGGAWERSRDEVSFYILSDFLTKVAR